MRDDIRAADKPIAAKYAGKDCTLDGHPARICGERLRYAIIATIGLGNGPLYSVEYSWPTVERVYESGGRFKSR